MTLKAITGILLTVLLIGMLTLAFNIQQAEASEPPATEWTRTYGGAGSDTADSVVKTSDGGYALAGPTTSFGAGLYDFWLVKVDSYGNMQWNKTYGGANRSTAHSVVETGDGGYALAGLTESFGLGGRDFWLVKVDSSGNHQWNKTYGGDKLERAFSVVVTGDGGYALAGATMSFGAGENDFWLVKVDFSGNMDWNKTYGGTSPDIARSVVKASDNGYALAGETASSGAGYYDFWLVKVDFSGNMDWNKTYGGAGMDVANSLVATGDGGYALAGHTTSFGAGDHDFWLVKVDSSGNHQWNKTYGGAGSDWAFSVVVTGDGGYALAGYTGSFGAGEADFWLVKVDSSGNHQWNKTYGGAGSDFGQCVVVTRDGGYAIAGETSSFGADGMDAWLVKVAGPTPVGGVWVPVDRFGLLAPYIGLASTIILATVATAVFIKRKKKQ